MQVRLSDDAIEVSLARWEKTLGLMRDIRVSRRYIQDARVVDDGLREAMRAPGLKAGLRLPWLMYICRSIKLDQAWIVRRGRPALTFAVRDGGTLKQVTVSTRDAGELAERLARPPG